MESQAKYTIVGVTVIGFILSIIVFALWLSKINVNREISFYLVYFKEQTLDGLQIDSNVTMKGIKVGSVDNVEIDSTNIENVEVKLKLSSDTPVKVDTRATIKRNLLTGLAYIDLVNSTQSSPLLKSIPTDSPFPIIIEERSNLEKLSETLPEIFKDLGTTISRVNKVFSKENIATVNSILLNVETLTKGVSNRSEDVAKTIENIKNISEDLSSLTKDINQITQTSKGSVDNIISGVKEGVKNIKELSSQLKDDLQGIASSVKSSLTNLSPELNSLVSQLDLTSKALTSTVSSYQNPRKILTGPAKEELGPGE